MAHRNIGLIFSGQGHPWQDTARQYAGCDPELEHTWQQVRHQLAQVPELAALSADFTPDGLLDPWHDQELAQPFAPAVSVPGILAAQLATARQLPTPVEVFGHSQGRLAAAVWQGVPLAECIAAAYLIGAAMQRRAASKPCLWAVSGLLDDALRTALAEDPAVVVGLRNGPLDQVLVGTPATVSAAAQQLRQTAYAQIQPLEVYAPFHHPNLRVAVAEVAAWARAAGFPVASIRQLAEAIMVQPVDWPQEFQPTQATEFVVVGAAQPPQFLCEPARARGLAVCSAATFDPAHPTPAPRAYNSYAPTTANGHVVTEFTRRTGHHPVLLGAMTPTTASPELVSAAANAGYWAELAGGGNATAADLRTHIAQLRSELQPGRRAQFNAMVMDARQWDLQFGSKHVVRDALADTTPFAGVTFAAGLPDAAVLAELPASWFALKVGGTSGIDQALGLVEQFPHRLFIVQLEGHLAGGHHTKKQLHQMLLARYGAMRSHPNVLIAVGGGIRPEQAPAYFSGQWAPDYAGADTPRMPVDAIFIGTPALVAAEAPTSAAVKELLAHGDYEVTSLPSSYGASMYMVDNDFTAAIRAARNPDTPRAALIAALARTARPYFGDIDQLTYTQWLQRYVELSQAQGQWLHADYAAMWAAMLARCEARLHPQDRGSFTSQLDLPSDADPATQIAQLLQYYPQADTQWVHPSDARWFLHRLRRGMKPPAFVPELGEHTLFWLQRDSLWQSQADCYDAQQVCITPSPCPQQWHAGWSITDILAEYEQRTIAALDLTATAELADVRSRAVAPPYQAWGTAFISPWPQSEDHTGLAFPSTADAATTPPAARAYDFIARWAQHAVAPAYPQTPSEELLAAMWPAVYELLGNTPPVQVADTSFPAWLPSLVHTYQSLRVLQEWSGALQAEAYYVAAPTDVQAAAEPSGEHSATFWVQINFYCAEVQVAQGLAAFHIRQGASCLPPQQAADLPASPHQASPAPENTNPASLAAGEVVYQTTVTTPATMHGFIQRTGDANPVHHQAVVAAALGYPECLVHGMWFVTHALRTIATHHDATHHDAIHHDATHHDAAPKPWWQACAASFVAPVTTNSVVDCQIRTTGQGYEVRYMQDGVVAVRVGVQLRAPRTAYLYPGQGVQHQDMGRQLYATSPIAHEIWQRAEQHCRQWGFSLLHIVQQNPREIQIGQRVYRHPAGVLHLTQFTQVALTVAGYAATAHWREQGAIDDAGWFAGHSLGEYIALSAYAQVLSLETVLDIVYERGLTMDQIIARDEHGCSAYAMAAVRPQHGPADFDLEQACAELVAAGEFVEIVNFNVRDRQYAVAGTKQALTRLASQLPAAAYREIPGVDVPFHSRILQPGVAQFRDFLDAALPATLPTEVLEGRYIPNVVGRPFALTTEFLEQLHALPGIGTRVQEVTWDLDDPAFARWLFVELLAWQFASPVRWIETTEFLQHEAGVEQAVEVGLREHPTLATMWQQTSAIPVYNTERDFPRPVVVTAPWEDAGDLLADAGTAPVTPATPQRSTAQAPALQTAAPETTAASSAPTTPEPTQPATLPVADVATRVRLLIAWWLQRPLADVISTTTIEALTGGVSARRNQIVADLQAEFGVPPISQAAELPLQELIAQLEQQTAQSEGFGPVLLPAFQEQLSALGKPAGMSRTAIQQTITQLWPAGVAPVELALILDPPADATQLRSAVQQRTRALAAQAGVQLADAVTTPETSVSAAGVLQEFVGQLRDFLDTVDSDATQHADAAELAKLQDSAAQDSAAQERAAEPAARIPGTAPLFAADRIRLFDDAWAYERERAWRAQVTPAAVPPHPAADSNQTDTTSTQQRVVITGVSEGSIGEQVLRTLLAQQAQVVVTTHTTSPEKLRWLRELYGACAQGAARMWVVPANVASYSDIDALAAWLDQQQWRPTHFYALAAPAVTGSSAEVSATFEYHMRVLMWGVERMVHQLGQIQAAGYLGQRLRVILAGSPNQGVLGGDGGYGEAKAALQVLVNKWFSDPWLHAHVSFALVQFGWVAGTQLMGQHDAQIADATAVLQPRQAAEYLLQAGAATGAEPAIFDYSALFPQQVTWLRRSPAELTSPAEPSSPADPAPAGHKNPTSTAAHPQRIAALPNLPQHNYTPVNLPTGQLPLEEMVVVCGIGELSTWGTSSTRYQAEFTGHLSAAGIIELAWASGLITWQETPQPGWYWGEQHMPEDQLATALEDVVLAQCGIRKLQAADLVLPELPGVELGETTWQEISVQRPLRLPVEYEHLARQLAEQPGVRASWHKTQQRWEVTVPAGYTVRVPVHTTLARLVGGPIPTDFDPATYGIPDTLLQQWDRLEIWNLISTIEAFLSAGIDPDELLEAVDPTRVANTQGTGMGAQQAIAKLYAQRLLGQHLPSDVVQETLGNVMAAHVVQSYVGSTGSLLSPVAACATAAVSIEAAIDKIELGKADVVLAGGFDDYSAASLAGFALMDATADDAALAAGGYQASAQSRPNDRARAGFVEAAGGGSVLVARGSVAAELGLPVLAVLAGAETYSDGIQQSIPAPGFGLQAAAHGQLPQRLHRLGVEVADIAVISKHDTSTPRNDPHEAQLYQHILQAWGRDPQQLVPVISQKAVTGHTKAGAALLQLAGLIDAMRTGSLPPHRNLDCVDPALQAAKFLVWPRTPADLPIPAGLLSSLGFGHVGTLLAVVHPTAFWQRLEQEQGSQAYQDYQRRAQHRQAQAARRRAQAQLGLASLYHPRSTP